MKKRTLKMLIATLCITPFVVASPYSILAEENSGNLEQLQIQEWQTQEVSNTGVVVSNDYIFDELDINAPVLDESETEDGILHAQSVPSSYASNIDQLTAKYPEARDQNPYGTCWAFASVGLAEFDLINDGIYDKNVDLSELQLAYFTYNFEKDPLGGTEGDTAKYTTGSDGPNYLNFGGNYQMASRRLTQWIGAVNESDVPYSAVDNVLSNGVESKYAYSSDVAHLENAYVLSLKNNPEEVKKQIMAHGAAGASYLHRNDGLSYNTSLNRYVYYDSENSGGGHAVMIVGWDDNFSKDNFGGSNKPSADGAWLIRNSWGTYVDYFWMSYENASLQDGAWIFDFTTNNNYDNNYQLDGGLDSYYTSYLKAANVFKAKSVDGVAAETLKAISLSTSRQTNVGYKIAVYTDLKDVSNPTSGTLWENAITTGTITYAGIHTIELSSPVVIMPGSMFSVVVTVDKPAIDYEQAVSYEIDGNSKLDCIVSLMSGNSFYASSADGNLYKWGYGNFCIKAFTDDESSIPDISQPEAHKCEENWNTEMTIDVQPTCTAKGKKSIHCKVCNAEKAGSAVEIPAKGHNWKQVSSESGVTNYKCSTCGATKSEGTTWNGLHEASDGNVYLYVNGKINTDFNDLYNDTNYGWKKISNGKVDSGYSDLYCSPTYGWWKVTGGAVDFGYTDLYESPTCGWWKVTGGAVDFGYTDLYESPTCGWWKVAGGAVDFGYTDLYESSTCGWWKVTGGAVDFGYTDLYESPACGWWKVTGGAVDFGYTDLYESLTCGWWKVTGGAVDFGYTDLYESPTCGWWKVTGGAVDFGYTGWYTSPQYGNWYINGGSVVF